MADYGTLPPHKLSVTIHPPAYHVLGSLVYAATPPLVGPGNAVLLLRLLSCAMASGVIWLVYRAASLLGSRAFALLAAGCVAGVPMYVSLSGAVTNEDFAALMASASLYLIIAGVVQGFTWRRVWWLSTWIALGIGTKITCISLIPAAWLALVWSGRRQGLPAASILRQIVAPMALTIALTGWWFARNKILYGRCIAPNMTDAEWDKFQPGYVQFHRWTGISARRLRLLGGPPGMDIVLGGIRCRECEEDADRVLSRLDVHSRRLKW